MSQTFQLLQVTLFSLPIIALVVLGIVILVKPVVIIHRRWYLIVFLPMLLANLLPYLENVLSVEPAAGSNWRLWLIVAADLLLTGWIVHTFRGLQLIGLPAKDITHHMEQLLISEGYQVQLSTTKKEALWGSQSQTHVLIVSVENHNEEIRIIEKTNETILQIDSPNRASIFKSLLLNLRNSKVAYDFKQHAMGLLYIVLAMVLGVLGWSFFFEPRLILIE
jgi:hypothetical protein